MLVVWRRKKVKLLLKKPVFKAQNVDTECVIYEDAAYTSEIYLSNFSEKIVRVTLSLNGNEIGVSDEIVKQSDLMKCRIHFIDGNTGFNQPFLLQCDLILLSVEVILEDGKTLDFFTPFLLCVSKNKEDSENIEEMVSELLKFDDDKISKWVFSKKNEDNIQNGLLEGTLRQKSYKSIFSFIQLLNEIIQCYQKNYVYFKSMAKHSIASNIELKEYTKVRTFGVENFEWLSRNLEQLSVVENKSAILYNNQYYLPYKVMTEQKKLNYDIYENRVIVSFLKEIITDAERIQKELTTSVINEENIFQTLKCLSFQGYHSPIVTVKNFQIKHSKKILDSISNLIYSAKKILQAYLKILPCKVERLVCIPRKTKVFQEIKPYRFVFEMIVKWYQYGEVTMEKENILFQVKTMDKIFEYYCLIQLLKMLEEEGYDILNENNSIDFFEYESNDGKYENEREVANTYHLYKEDTSIVLYYQPVVCAEGYMNGLSLYRTTSQKGYYTPDFIIKIMGNTETSYIILDAKYSSRENIRKFALENCILKYGVQIEDSENERGVKMVWMLQGRVDGTTSMYRYHISPNARMNKQLKSYGIVSVNTKINIRSRLWNEIMSATRK